MFIGELSDRVALPTQTIRYYERLGLLNPPERTESQYRIYSEEAVERLQFIQKAKLYGLSLDEIKQLIELRDEGVLPCANLKAMVKKHLNELDYHIQEMLVFRQELANRYEQIDTLLSGSSPAPREANFNGRICGLIEREQDSNT
ncbi:heavy metal-responsive transcriptional regulator [Gloeocapsopsis dulcis]|uniref:Heavy metal-responsive transcriptional regulator n=1 Tax=Gloeocapsopsis dulcis AAB1 = 1H9 TaxID=1433147 RepID=A0A6N8G2D5_9CHRO|nr:heavy metal-responsive transcriptional regulator [Gloeocapsopsis dulcis]MUL38507.1 heavy metal-responsive transcriptional regulator [Gloeocapsopsis dulcis AAB1 = 1H9]WNN91631.1 heavy metal-responsive transcriptional regulator [Gloeocapsopsis dulcis]